MTAAYERFFPDPDYTWWCPRCRKDAIPILNGICGFCETIIATDKGQAVYNRRGGYPRLVRIPHGTKSGYRHHRCRCVRCTDAHRKAMADYEAKRKTREAIA